jgi:hypothetical protein
MDVKMDLQEEVYMDIPPGFELSEHTWNNIAHSTLIVWFEAITTNMV